MASMRKITKITYLPAFGALTISLEREFGDTGYCPEIVIERRNGTKRGGRFAGNKKNWWIWKPNDGNCWKTLSTELGVHRAIMDILEGRVQ